MRTATAAGAASTINVAGASALYKNAIVELDNGQLKETFTVASTAGNTVTLSGNIANVYYEGNNLYVIEAQVNVVARTGPRTQKALAICVSGTMGP